MREAYQSELGYLPGCRMVLVIEGKFPDELIELKSVLGIECIEVNPGKESEKGCSIQLIAFAAQDYRLSAIRHTPLANCHPQPPEVALFPKTFIEPP